MPHTHTLAHMHAHKHTRSFLPLLADLVRLAHRHAHHQRRKLRHHLEDPSKLQAHDTHLSLSAACTVHSHPIKHPTTPRRCHQKLPHPGPQSQGLPFPGNITGHHPTGSFARTSWSPTHHIIKSEDSLTCSLPSLSPSGSPLTHKPPAANACLSDFSLNSISAHHASVTPAPKEHRSPKVAPKCEFMSHRSRWY